MSVDNSSPLMRLLGGREAVRDFDPEDWSLAFSEARRAGVISRLGAELCCQERESISLPERLRKHASASLIEAEAFRRDVFRELDYIEQALKGLGVPVLLLKGASYVRLGLLAAQGRIFSDVDILVAKDQLGAVEAALMLGGWLTGKLDSYDQRYYREWSHEVPPMTHKRRGTTIDLHHALVMPTCRIFVDSEKMVRAAIPVEGSQFWWRLKNEDMLLHASSHLILNSEFERGLRDLWDIDLLFRQFSHNTPDFSDLLMARAADVGLDNIARQALYLARRIFRTPIPDWVMPKKRTFFVKLLERAISTRHSDTRPSWQGVTDAILSYREMYLRLPNRLLGIHLVHKTAGGFRNSVAPQGASIA